MTSFLSRHTSAVIAVGAVLTGTALWAILYLKLGFDIAQSSVITGLVLLSLAQVHVYRERVSARKTIQDELERIMVSTHDLLGDVAALRDDVQEMRKSVGEKNYLHADKIANQVAALEAVVERLDDAHVERAEAEQLITRELEALATAARSANRTSRSTDAPATEDERGSPRRRRHKVESESARNAADLMARVSGAISGSRVDLYLQPIVTLPQRKVRYYEALTRLRDEEGHIIMPRDYLPAAREAGLTTDIDNMLLFRSIALVRRLMERKRDVGVFCNISTATLLDADFFPQFIEFMETNAELSPVLIFEFAEPALDTLGPLEEESLNALAALGFRFSLDHVTSLDIDFGRLASLGFRFVKVDATVMLDTVSAGSARVHPEDIARLAERHGVELIVEKIEAENTVVNILDYDVRLAQGYLFARPRLVREDGAPVPFRAAA